MEMERRKILNVLGWKEGTKIPAANDENRKLEIELEELLRKKSQAAVNLCVMKDNVKHTKKLLASLEYQRTYNQDLLNRLSMKLDSEMGVMKETQLKQNLQGQDMRHWKRRVQDLKEKMWKCQREKECMMEKLEHLKQSTLWGSDVIFKWENVLAVSDQETKILEHYKEKNKEKFQALQKERQDVEKDLNDAVELEKREQERFRILSAQLENVYKLQKEANAEQERLMSVYRDSVEKCNEREETNKRLSEEVLEVNNAARNDCSQLHEEQLFYDKCRNSNDLLKTEIDTYFLLSTKTKDDMASVEEDVNNLSSELNVKRKLSGSISGQIEMERIKNKETESKNSARLSKLSKIHDVTDSLKDELQLMDVDTTSKNIKVKTAGDIYDMKRKQIEEEEKEITRLNSVAYSLRQEIDNMKRKQAHKIKDRELTDNLLRTLTNEFTKKEFELKRMEQNLFLQIEEVHTLTRKIAEFRDKCSGKDQEDEIRKEISLYEEQENTFLRDHIQIKKRLEVLQKEYKDKLKVVETTKVELNKITESYFNKYNRYKEVKEEIENVKEEKYKMNAKLKILKMKEMCLKENINQTTSLVGALEHKRNLLEMAMKNRQKDVENQRDILLSKKRSLLEERMIKQKQIDHISGKINLIQTKYGTTIDLMGKDDSGQSLTVAYFKIKLAQEKYELQLKYDELEAEITKSESELRAMENTVKWVKATNENFKFSIEPVDETDPIRQEYDMAERKYYDLKAVLEKENENVSLIQIEIKELMNDIEYHKNREEEYSEEIRKRNKELIYLENDIFKKMQRYDRATDIMKKLMIAIYKSHEPPKYKQLSQREIFIRMEEERNKRVLDQLVFLGSEFHDMRFLLEQYSKRYNVDLPPRSVSFSRSSSRTSQRSVELKRKDSSSSTTLSGVSVINLDPFQLFANVKSPCFNKRK